MNNFNKTNTVLGWVTFIVALVVYWLTLEPSVSLWDCGEFISASYRLQIVHPPGAPLFLMIGRIFSLFAGDDPTKVPIAVNMLSAVSSAATVMFTFWITTHFAKKIAGVGLKAVKVDTANAIAILGSGLVAALSVTFMDTFWFSAVEAEVYAASSCFMALAFWAITKWEKVKNESGSDRWLVFIAYTIGLGIGLHLLNLLVIPAIVYYYYFNKFGFSLEKSEDGSRRKHLLVSTIIGFGIIAILQFFIIPMTPEIAANFDRLFVNSFGMPFNSGMLFFMILVGVALATGIQYSHSKNKLMLYISLAIVGLMVLVSLTGSLGIIVKFVLLGFIGYLIYHFAKDKGKGAINLFMLCFTFIMLGFSSYSMVVIRSLAEPAIDMNDPEDAHSLLSYINREQYGDRPLLKGPYWMAQYVGADSEEGATQYARNEERHQYVETGNKPEYIWNDEYTTILPRMGDMSEKSKFYHVWCGMEDVFKRIDALERQLRNTPRGDAKKRGEIQDQINRLKVQKPTFKNNMQFLFKYQIGWMYMRYFMWNFVGRQSDKQNVTGNKTEGNWISGIAPIDKAVQGIPSDVPKYMENKGRNTYYFLPLILGLIGFFFQAGRSKIDFFTVLAMFIFTGVLIVIYLNQPPMEPRERDYTFVGSFQTFCIWIGLSVMAMVSFMKRFIKGSGASLAATAIALLAAPMLMGSQNWDDHDRSDRYLGIDYAKNYLESCDTNAILFTNGDNDTYPLWYAQNVENVRPDVRVINLSLLPTEWYSSALRRKIFDSEPLPMEIPASKLVTGLREYMRFDDAGVDKSKFYDINNVIDKMMVDNPAMGYRQINTVPARTLRMEVDKEAVIASGLVRPSEYDKIVDRMRWSLGSRRGLSKGDLVVLDVIRTNAKTGWKRPIHWTTTTGNSVYLGLDKYLRHNGLTYQLIPVERNKGSQGIDDLDDLNNKLMNVYKWGNIEKGTMFLDDKAQLVPQNLRNLFVNVAGTYARTDRKEKAVALLDKCFASVPESVLPMTFNTKASAISVYYEAGKMDQGDEKIQELANDAMGVLRYLSEFRDRTPFGLNQERSEALQALKNAGDIAGYYKRDFAETFKGYYKQFGGR